MQALHSLALCCNVWELKQIGRALRVRHPGVLCICIRHMHIASGVPAERCIDAGTERQPLGCGCHMEYHVWITT